MLQVGFDQEGDGGQEDEHHRGKSNGLGPLGGLWIFQHVPEIRSEGTEPGVTEIFFHQSLFIFFLLKFFLMLLNMCTENN